MKYTLYCKEEISNRATKGQYYFFIEGVGVMLDDNHIFGQTMSFSKFISYNKEYFKLIENEEDEFWNTVEQQ